MSEENYRFEVVAGRSDIALIELGISVMGGSDAMEFSHLLNNLQEQGIRFVIVNIENVKLINSSGLGMLLGGLTALKKHDMQLLLTNIPDKVQNLFAMTHLDKVFKTYSDVSHAIDDCK